MKLFTMLATVSFKTICLLFVVYDYKQHTNMVSIVAKMLHMLKKNGAHACQKRVFVLSK